MSARVKGLGGAVISIAICAGAIIALTKALQNVDYNQVFEIIRATDFSTIALAMMLTGILTTEQAYAAIGWKSVFLVAGMLQRSVELP